MRHAPHFASTSDESCRHLDSGATESVVLHKQELSIHQLKYMNPRFSLGVVHDEHPALNATNLLVAEV